MYELRFHPQVDRELKALPKGAKAEIKAKHLPAIQASPFEAGRSLSGPLRRFRRYAFSHGGVSYRIVYEVDREEGVIYVLMIGKREGFYERLRRRVRGSE